MNFKILLILFFISSSILVGQQRKTATFGEPTKADFDLKSYPKDPEAAAVVLFESGNYYFKLVDNYVKLIKEVYIKTKVFDASKFNNSIVQIPFYFDKNDGEKISKIKALTHNGELKTYVADKQYYDVDVRKDYKIKRFTYPNIKDGSILELSYTIESPYLGNLNGWFFQTTIPTIYSELHTELPGNYKYMRSMKGLLPLYINESDVKKACFSIEGYAVPADCDRATYAMVDVPAFKEESYMLGDKTYLSQIMYELTEIVSINGDDTKKIAESWDDIDTFFKYDSNFGGQLKNESFFKDKIPEKIASIVDDLERTKAIYYFIQNHFSWNNEVNIWSGIDVKDAFEKGSGNNSDINLSLINALNLAKLDAKIMLISTRENGTPTQEYPVKSDFNFVIAQLNINGEIYLLDATEKNTPFGVLPFRDLNKSGRVMDFKKGSYWQDIVPNEKNIYYANAQIVANANGTFTGKVSQAATGYISIEQRVENYNLSQAQLNQKKQSKNENLEISSYKIENKEDLDSPYKQNYDLTLEPEMVGDQVYLYPFFTENYISENPFIAEKRTYPIDFGFPFTNTYLVNIDLGEFYEVAQIPENRMIKLPENDGSLSIAYDVSGTKINVRLSVQLNAIFYNTDAYISLQEYFKTLIGIQKDEPIVLKKL